MMAKYEKSGHSRLLVAESSPGQVMPRRACWWRAEIAMRPFRNVPKSPEFLDKRCKTRCVGGYTIRRAPEGPAELSASVVSVLSTLRQAGGLPSPEVDPASEMSAKVNALGAAYKALPLVRNRRSDETGSTRRSRSTAVHWRSTSRATVQTIRPQKQFAKNLQLLRRNWGLPNEPHPPSQSHDAVSCPAKAELLFEHAARDPRRSDPSIRTTKCVRQKSSSHGSGVKPEAR